MRLQPLFAAAAAAALAAAFIAGAVNRKSYTNYIESEGVSHFAVAELPGAMAETDCQRMLEEIPEAPQILRISVQSDSEYFFGGSQQKVQAETVYSGSALKPGDIFYLTASQWSLTFNEPAAIQRGFINFLEPGREYLVFLSDPLDKLTGDLPVFSLFGDTIIAPAFCCDEIENTIAPIEGDTLYVAYDQVKENEFFGADQAALDAWAQTKQKLLEMYGL